MIIIFKSIIGWLLFMLIGTNILGVIVRGLIQHPVKDGNEENKVLNDEIDKQIQGYVRFSFIFLFVAVGYFYLLYHYWNIGVMISAMMVMLSRLPDLLLEIKTGKKINWQFMPKRPIDYFTIFLDWAAIPVLWYSLYSM